MKKMKRSFTLIEMTIVLFIISLLILIIIPNLTHQRKHAQSVHTTAMSSVRSSTGRCFTSQHPTIKSVGFAEITREGYLTRKQVNQAKDEGLKITNNEVTE